MFLKKEGEKEHQQNLDFGYLHGRCILKISAIGSWIKKKLMPLNSVSVHRWTDEWMEKQTDMLHHKAWMALCYVPYIILSPWLLFNKWKTHRCKCYWHYIKLLWNLNFEVIISDRSTWNTLNVGLMVLSALYLITIIIISGFEEQNN